MSRPGSRHAAPSLTAVAQELEQAQFTVAMRGYEPREVRDLLGRAAAEIREFVETEPADGAAITEVTDEARRSIDAAYDSLVAVIEQRRADLASLPAITGVLSRVADDVVAMFNAVEHAALQAAAVARRQLEAAREERRSAREALLAMLEVHEELRDQLGSAELRVEQARDRAQDVLARIPPDESPALGGARNGEPQPRG